MMDEIQEHRRKDRDFTSLVDQIRCLQRRYDLLQKDEYEEEENLRRKLEDQSLEIENLKNYLEELRNQLINSKRGHEHLKEEYI